MVLTAYIQQNIQSIINLAIALVPLVIAFLTLFNSKTEKVKTPLDPSLKVIRIERTGVDKTTWNAVTDLKGNTARFVLYTLVTAAALYVVLKFFHVRIAILYLLIILLYARFLVNFWVGLYKFRCKDGEEGRFYLFRKAHLEVEGNVRSLFFRAQEALMGKRIKYIDADYDNLTISAFREGGIITTPGKITVSIASAENSAQAPKQGQNKNTGRYCITVNFEPSEDIWYHFSNAKSGLRAHLYTLITRIPLMSSCPAEAYRIEASSRVTNHFIEKFLRKKAVLAAGDGAAAK